MSHPNPLSRSSLPYSLGAVHPSSPLWGKGRAQGGKVEIYGCGPYGKFEGVGLRYWQNVTSLPWVTPWVAGERALSWPPILALFKTLTFCSP